MESTTTQSPQLTPEQAREGLLKMYQMNTTTGHVGPRPENLTFCQCCGSQYLRADGLIPYSSMLLYPDANADEKYMARTYGRKHRERFTTPRWNELTAQVSRHNAPGVTAAIKIELAAALDLLYSGETRQLADGYQINDKDHGTISILWVNK